MIKPTGDDELLAVVQIPQGGRELLGGANVRQLEAQIRQDRPTDDLEEIAKHELEVANRRLRETSERAQELAKRAEAARFVGPVWGVVRRWMKRAKARVPPV